MPGGPSAPKAAVGDAGESRVFTRRLDRMRQRHVTTCAAVGTDIELGQLAAEEPRHA